MSASRNGLSQRARVNELREALRRRFGIRIIPDPRSLTPSPRGRHPSHGRGVHAFALVAVSLLAAALGLEPRPAQAGTWRVDANLASAHTERWARDSLNQRNPGIGITYQFDRTWAIAGGIYDNSYRRPSTYALAEWTPLHIGNVHGWHMEAGLVGGLAGGYTRTEVLCSPFAVAAMIRVAAPAGIALNLLGVPNTGPRDSGFVGFQISFPMP